MEKVITFKEIETFLSKIEQSVEQQLKLIDSLLDEGKKTASLPQCFTKRRIKSANSVFLKTKRKAKSSLHDITDYGGFRVLCLFEQDLKKLHAFLLEKLLGNGFIFTECILFNWEDSKNAPVPASDLLGIAKERGCKAVNDKGKTSGYRSIHYVVHLPLTEIRPRLLIEKPKIAKPISIEIQLRTVLQDAWAELEHAINYKNGLSNPHIAKNFQLLSRDLATDDQLIAYLRQTRDNERLADQYALQKNGPFKAFKISGRRKPSVFSDDRNPLLVDAYARFVSHAYSARPEKVPSRRWAENGLELLEGVRRQLDAADLTEDRIIKNWFQLEQAFLEFCKGELERAMQLYQLSIDGGEKHYVPRFRLGEIFFVKGEIERALHEFDNCESILRKHPFNKEIENAFQVKLKLANIYWKLGPEYHRIARDEIIQAENIYKSQSELFSNRQRVSLTNNLCWYELEYFRTIPDSRIKEAAFKRCRGRYDNLLKVLKDEEVGSNEFDTAAWFCYVAFLYTNRKTYLEKAKDFCEETWRHENKTTLRASSVGLQRSHLTQILNTHKNGS